jgi:hypothetical protein
MDLGPIHIAHYAEIKCTTTPKTIRPMLIHRNKITVSLITFLSGSGLTSPLTTATDKTKKRKESISNKIHLASLGNRFWVLGSRLWVLV